jgi:hypothetical protein
VEEGVLTEEIEECLNQIGLVPMPL